MADRWDRFVVSLINFQIKHFTSKRYQKRIHRLMGLGHLKLREIMLAQETLNQKMADAPSVDPKTGVMTDPKTDS